MISRTVSIICFSALLSGCSTFYPTHEEKWKLPPQPKIKSVNIEEYKTNINYQGGFYLSVDEATKMADDVDELKSYIQKLEILVREMAKYYNAKVEEK